MKLKYIGWCLASFLVVTSSALQASDVIITVNGKVVAKPCMATTDASVHLGTLYTSKLNAAGSASEWISFELSLSSCPIGTSQVMATFAGQSDSTGYYENLGTADNIQIELSDDTDTTLNNGATKSVTVDDGHRAYFKLKARALSVKGRATQGTIQSVINVTYTYQ